MTEGCERCEVWALRHQVAVHAAYEVTLHIREPELREVILDHITSAWVLCISRGGHPDGFAGFFTAYCTDVARDADPLYRSNGRYGDELRRVWTNHAALLHGTPSLIERRGSAA